MPLTTILIGTAVAWISSLVITWYMASRVGWAEGGRDVFSRELKEWQIVKSEAKLVAENVRLQEELDNILFWTNEYGERYQQEQDAKFEALQTNESLRALLSSLNIYLDNGKVYHNREFIAYMDKNGTWKQPNNAKGQQPPQSQQYQ